MPIFISINTNINLAPFAEKRLDFIRGMFSHVADPKTPLQESTPAFFIQNNETKEIVLFADNCTNYIKDQITPEWDFGRFFKPLKEIIDKYELSETFNITLSARWIDDCKKDDMFLKSIDFARKDILDNICSEFGIVSGVGLRILSNSSDGVYDDIRIEPYVFDKNKIFIEMTKNLLSVSIIDAETKIKEVIESADKCIDSLKITIGV